MDAKQQSRLFVPRAASNARLLASEQPDAFANGSPFGDVYPAENYAEYHHIGSLARDLNTQVQVPELVLIGSAGAGKSTLLEALIGVPLTPAADKSGWTSTRPLVVTLLNNPACETPKFTLKRDAAGGEEEEERDGVSPSELPALLAKRQGRAFNQTPLYLTCEHKHVLNMMVIDTPGLLRAGGADLESESPRPQTNAAEAVRETVRKLAEPSSRIIVYVEQASDWEEVETANFEMVKKLDPRLDRSIFVYTRFSDQLKKLTATRPLNRYFSSAPDLKSFFVTLPDGARRQKCFTGEGQSDPRAAAVAFAALLHAAYLDDMQTLEQLRFDRRYEPRIGAGAFKKYLMEVCWKRYQDSKPEVLKRLREMKDETAQRAGEVRAQAGRMQSYMLRATAGDYVTAFLLNITKLINGTLEGNPAQNGQTMQEEHEHEEAGMWVNANFEPIRPRVKKWGIQYHKSKLYGGQQFERLLSEFQAVMEHTEFAEASMDDVATAAGSQNLANYSNVAWAASDIAQKTAQKAFLPLIEQLYRRSVYIMKRLANIVDQMMESQRKEASKGRRGGASSASSASVSSASVVGASPGGAGVSVGGASAGGVVSTTDYPFFTNSVKELYYDFIDKTAAVCKAKSMDEFYSTRIIYWDQVEQSAGGSAAAAAAAAAEHSEELSAAAVRELASSIFDSIKKRVTRNVLLKCYNYFLLPLQNDLLGEIQGQINVLTDDSIEELFEVAVNKRKLEQESAHLVQLQQELQEKEAAFLAKLG